MLRLCGDVKFVSSRPKAEGSGTFNIELVAVGLEELRAFDLDRG